jgi:hypothetical protein
MSVNGIFTFLAIMVLVRLVYDGSTYNYDRVWLMAFLGWGYILGDRIEIALEKRRRNYDSKKSATKGTATGRD